MQLQRVRILTVFLVSIVTAPVYVLVGAQAWSRGVSWVVACIVVGLLASIWNARHAWRALAAPQRWRPSPTITAFLALFVTALVLTGYADGVGVIWCLCAPPLALLVHGTRVGGLVTAGMFVVLVVGLCSTATIDERMLAAPLRLRIGIAYVVIAASCLAASGASDWFHRKLGEASEELESLRAMLTMCAHCKRVRVDDSWSSIESFLDREQKLRFSHGVCEHCMQRHYPEMQRDGCGES